jgi:Ice-binding-like
VRRVLLKARFAPFVCFGMLLWAGPLTAQAAVPATAAGFAVLAGKAVTCTGPNSNVTGPVGRANSSTAVTKTGCTMQTQIAAGAYAAFVNAFKAPPAPCATTVTSDPGLHGPNTLPTGVSCFAVALTMTTGTLTLQGSGPWNIEIGTSGTGALTATNFTVISSNPCNVFWWVRQGVTLTGTAGTPPTAFQGTILAGADITLTDTSLTGRAWAGGTGTAQVPTGKVTLTRSPVLGCTAAGTVPGTKCAKDGGSDEDTNSDQSKNAEDSSSASDRSNNGNDEQGNQKDCKSGDSDKDKSDKPDSNKDDSNKGDSKRSDS